MAATKFSNYLGLKDYKKVKHFIHLRLAQRPQSFNTSEFRPSTKKVCSSDVMQCQISIFEIKMMVKISVIFMPFLNPTCHLPSTANLPVVSL